MTFPSIWRCAGDFFKVLLKLKMTAMNELHNFCSRKNSKIEVRNNSHFTITLPFILPSENVQVILLKFKMATTSLLFRYL